jgi:hypothetical protein
MEPARSWWPQVGCTILQTTAAAANATLSKVPAARKKIHESGGIPALVNLLSRGSAEARSHAATSVGLLAESPRLAYEVFPGAQKSNPTLNLNPTSKPYPYHPPPLLL